MNQNLHQKGPKKTARIATKSDITTIHCIFQTQIYASPENFTHPPDVMDVTFRRSATEDTILVSLFYYNLLFNFGPFGI